MKIALVRSVEFVRQKNFSIAFISEIGTTLEEGDCLEDIVKGTPYRVLGRSVSLRRTTETEPLLLWSREASIVLEGKCRDTVGRFLISGPHEMVSCITCKCFVSDRSHELPKNVPIVGAVRLDNYDCPAVLVVESDLSCQLAFVAQRNVSSVNELEFVLETPSNGWTRIGIGVESWQTAVSDGAIVSLVPESHTVEYV
jgi:hypothetical protein